MNSGRFEPGKSGNPKGKPKGATDHSTRKIRQWLDKFLDENTEQFQNDIMALKPKERVMAITALMEYSVPKLQRVENQHEGELNLSGIPVTKWAENGDNPEPEV